MKSLLNSLMVAVLAGVVAFGIGFSMLPQSAPTQTASRGAHVQIAKDKPPVQDGQETHG